MGWFDVNVGDFFDDTFDTIDTFAGSEGGGATIGTVVGSFYGPAGAAVGGAIGGLVDTAFKAKERNDKLRDAKNERDTLRDEEADAKFLSNTLASQRAAAPTPDAGRFLTPSRNTLRGL